MVSLHPLVQIPDIIEPDLLRAWPQEIIDEKGHERWRILARHSPQLATEITLRATAIAGGETDLTQRIINEITAVLMLAGIALERSRAPHEVGFEPPIAA